MPRQARIDIEGQFYHVMSRGIERGSIFLEEKDYRDFKDRVAMWLKESGAKCLAWCLMPNHFHLLLLRGPRPLSETMHHIMTGYAVNFNLRHERAGHLFQNRYKAVMCLGNGHLLELVPYIHLNPLRAGLVRDVRGLSEYRWCGHAAALIGEDDGILDREEFIGKLGADEKSALNTYKALIIDRAAGKEPEMTVASLEGMSLSALSGFHAMSEAPAGSLVPSLGRSEKWIFNDRQAVLTAIGRISGVKPEEILRPGRERTAARARAIYCYLCKEKLSTSGSELMLQLKVCQSAVSRLIAKGRGIVRSDTKIIQSVSSVLHWN